MFVDFRSIFISSLLTFLSSFFIFFYCPNPWNIYCRDYENTRKQSGRSNVPRSSHQKAIRKYLMIISLTLVVASSVKYWRFLRNQIAFTLQDKGFVTFGHFFLMELDVPTSNVLVMEFQASESIPLNYPTANYLFPLFEVISKRPLATFWSHHHTLDAKWSWFLIVLSLG